METVGTVPLHENQGPAGECTRHARADVIYNTTQVSLFITDIPLKYEKTIGQQKI